MITFGIIGLILISYALWVKSEKKQDIIYVIGGVALLIYSIAIEDIVFIVLQIIFILSASIELLSLKNK